MLPAWQNSEIHRLAETAHPVLSGVPTKFPGYLLVSQINYIKLLFGSKSEVLKTTKKMCHVLMIKVGKFKS